MCCHSFKRKLCFWLILLHSSLNEKTLQWLLQQQRMSLRKALTLLHFTAFPLPSVFPCHRSLAVTLGASGLTLDFTRITRQITALFLQQLLNRRRACRILSHILHKSHYSRYIARPHSSGRLPFLHLLIFLLQSGDTKSMALIRQDSTREFVLSTVLMLSQSQWTAVQSLCALQPEEASSQNGLTGRQHAVTAFCLFWLSILWKKWQKQYLQTAD